LPDALPIAALIVLFTHILCIGQTVSQSLDSRILSGRGSRHDGELMNSTYILHELTGSAAVSETPACHGESLGEAAYENCSLSHSGERCKRSVLLLVGEFGVNLIGDDENICILENLGYRHKLIAVHGCACGVVGVCQNDSLCLGSDGSLEFLGHELEAVFSLCHYGL